MESLVTFPRNTQHIHLIHRLDDKVNHIVSGNPVAKVGREKKPLIAVTGNKLFTHGPDYITALPFSIDYSHKFMDFFPLSPTNC